MKEKLIGLIIECVFLCSILLYGCGSNVTASTGNVESDAGETEDTDDLVYYTEEYEKTFVFFIRRRKAPILKLKCILV